MALIQRWKNYSAFFSKFFKNARQDLEKFWNWDNATKFKIMCIQCSIYIFAAAAQKLRKSGRHQNFANGARTFG